MINELITGNLSLTDDIIHIILVENDAWYLCKKEQSLLFSFLSGQDVLTPLPILFTLCYVLLKVVVPNQTFELKGL